MSQESEGIAAKEAIVDSEASDSIGEDGELTADQVAAYLASHPDFLAAHPELVAKMEPPRRWQGDAIVDLQQFMVSTLQAEIRGLRDCAHEVIETSRSNMACQSRTHEAVCALLSTGDLDQLIGVIGDQLPLLLDVDAVAVAIEPGYALAAGRDDIVTLAPGDVDRLIGCDRDVTICRDMGSDALVFGAAAGLVTSAALVRIRPEPDGAFGMIALGARSESLFHPRQGTELLRFLAGVIEFCLRRFLAPAR